MKKILGISIAVMFGFMGVADAATARGNARSGGAAAPAAKSTGGANAARAARTAPAPKAAPAGGANAARAATNQKAAGGTSSGGTKAVAARAAAKQKVVGGGTKVAAAGKNTVVSDACREKYDGCMDSFCMIENETGGRCMCSDKNATFDLILSEIEKLDSQSYAMATSGVERIEMGDDAEAAIANANAVADSLKRGDKPVAAVAERSALDLSLWDDDSFEEEEESIFGEEVAAASYSDPLEGKTGDALHEIASNLCSAQMPECIGEMQMLKMLYGQRIRSDCAAYENTLKQQKNASAKKLQTAEKALRDASLTQLREANKYDLGECTVEFKKCMVSTGGCGDDFSKCASVVAMENTNIAVRGTSKTYKIKGAVSTIEISPQTYDTLVAKKPLCESVTKQCKAVASQVWDTFLREVAPQLKSAELIAEDNARQDCIGNISTCFQKACKESMDPKDPEGSYDMCITRPENLLNVCKVPLNACGISTESAAAAEKSNIWEYVVARMASMRVNSCTNELKACLTSDDVCGSDYTQCIGLDTDSIIQMCHYDKLTGCQQVYNGKDIRGSAVYDELANMVQGIMLSIDNNMLAGCQKSLDEAMIKVCGDTENCDTMTIDENLGTRSLETKICVVGSDECYKDVTFIPESVFGKMADKNDKDAKVGNFRVSLDGEIPWDKISVQYREEELDADGNPTGKYKKPQHVLGISGLQEYFTTNNIEKETQNKINAEIATLQQNITNAINSIEADPMVQYCMTGRKVQGMNRASVDKDGNKVTARQEIGDGVARFPDLTTQVRGLIATSALKKVKDNYSAKYTEINEKMAKEYVKVAEKIAQARAENELEARRDAARISCTGIADKSIVGGNSQPKETGEGIYVGSSSRNDWNYKETVTATFSDTTLVCSVCKKTQNCSKPRCSGCIDSMKYCKTWAEVVEECKDTQF